MQNRMIVSCDQKPKQSPFQGVHSRLGEGPGTLVLRKVLLPLEMDGMYVKSNARGASKSCEWIQLTASEQTQKATRMCNAMGTIHLFDLEKYTLTPFSSE